MRPLLIMAIAVMALFALKADKCEVTSYSEKQKQEQQTPPPPEKNP